MKFKFTKKAFAEWLRSLPPRVSVGQPERSAYCPLCNFLKAQGAQTVWMGFTSRGVDHRIFDNPLWATKFQQLAIRHVNADRDRYITARTALAHLGR